MTIIALALFFFGTAIGVFLITSPKSAIKIQQKFYAKINWKIEPISLSKEIRNTRIMGFILIILLFAILFILCKNNPLP
ncbi:MAG: hypothetical protein AB1472_02680 [Candidatus Omnitrophota bacterium]